MKLLIAPDSFKHSLSALQFCAICENVIQKRFREIEADYCPLSDGGEGFLETLIHNLGGRIVQCRVRGPYFQPVLAEFGLVEQKKMAIIEMARSSGLELTTEAERDTKSATTLGFGELISAALDRGVERIILGIGGSATTDAGAGMACALGYRFLNADGETFVPTGATLGQVAAIDTTHVDPRLDCVKFVVACDVTNPLYGNFGAARVYAPQKGAAADDVALLDRNLALFAQTVKDQLSVDEADTPGTGAAGGLGYGLIAFCRSELKSGIEMFLDIIDFDARLKSCDWVVVGEGRFDDQVLFGKAIKGVADRAARHGKPVIVICGANFASEETLRHLPSVKSVFSICQHPLSLEDALKQAPRWLEESFASIVALLSSR